MVFVSYFSYQIMVYNMISHPGPDLRELYEDTTSTKNVKYGTLSSEYMEIMVPSADAKGARARD